MRKLSALLLTLLLILTIIAPVSAVTTLKWDWGRAQGSIGDAAAQIVREQETTPAEYTAAEKPDYTETEPEPAAETTHEQVQSWRDWLRSRSRWLRYEKE